MEHTRKTYTKEFKLKAIELSNARGSVISIAKELDINIESLRRWKKEYRKGNLALNPIKPTNRDPEMLRLQKALRESELENAILKKAVAIFSRNGL
jgi:transposase